jgi:hypothetical protein
MSEISKIEAAERQLETAVELHLHEYDLLAAFSIWWT